jgi:hypothetical protein
MERAPTDVHAAPPAAAPADMSTMVDFLQGGEYVPEYSGALTPDTQQRDERKSHRQRLRIA